MLSKILLKVLRLIKANNIGANFLLLMIVLVFFCRTIVGKYVYWLDDLKIIYYPLEFIFAQYQTSWKLPLWSTYLGFGHPVLAWGQLGFFTPVHVFLRLFSINPLTLLQISIVCYFYIGLSGMFWFLRQNKISFTGAIAGATIFTLSGFNIGHLNHVNFYTATMLLPWLLFFIDRFFIKRGARNGVMIAVISASMVLSGQPQVVIYSLLMALILFLIRLCRVSNMFIASRNMVLIGVLALSLSSFGILPLFEFLPESDRAAGVSREEMFGFSYAPWHSITIIFPYFYGDHGVYWGEKNFQELAGYVGIIPLMLTGASLVCKPSRRHRPLYELGIFLILTSIILGLGRYSLVYRWLVENDVLNSLTVPGRWIFYFCTGIAVLSAVGYETIKKAEMKWRAVVGGTFLPVLILIVFFWKAKQNQVLIERFDQVLDKQFIETQLITVAILFFWLAVLMPASKRRKRPFYVFVVVLSTLTLIVYGWNYNPVTPTAEAYKDSLLLSKLMENQSIEKRIFNTKIDNKRVAMRTEEISPQFTVYQPVTFEADKKFCLFIPFSLDKQNNSVVKIQMLAGLGGPVLQEYFIDTTSLIGPQMKVCFDRLPANTTNGVMGFSSNDNSGLRLGYIYSENLQDAAYFVRVSSPTIEQLNRSRKSVKIQIVKDIVKTDQYEETLAPHLNVQANASSANWVGSLAIGSYKSFVTSLLSDGGETIDGDGNHVINVRRKLLDLAGVTHVVVERPTSYPSIITSPDWENVIQYDSRENIITLYKNERVKAKAFMVKEVEFSPVLDETFYAMTRESFDPDKKVYVSGPVPPVINTSENPDKLEGEAQIIEYLDTKVDISTKSNVKSWLVVTDSTTNNWQTYIDGVQVPYYAAYGVFKAAEVPAGEHLVSFRYRSRAVELAKYLTVGGMIVSLVLLKPRFTARVAIN